MADRLSGGQMLVRELVLQGVEHVFCVPGESYLAVLDALYEAPIAVTVCRHEGGAAMMAEAHGKLSGRPGICFVTRGPGATNASSALHIAKQDSTPMILFVGQVERGMQDREAFQELDYRASFGSMVKWATEVESSDRLPEIVSRAFYVSMSGRPGPVVIALPEDMLLEQSSAAPSRKVNISELAPTTTDLARLNSLLEQSQRPLLIAGGSGWSNEAVEDLIDFSEKHSVPIAVSFRRQGLFPATHSHFVGDIGVGSNPELISYAREADLIILLGGRLSELPSQSYTLVDIPIPRQKLIHIHSGTDEIGKIYSPDLAFNLAPGAFLKGAALLESEGTKRADYIIEGRALYERWSGVATVVPGAFNLGEALLALSGVVPSDAVVCNGAGNYAVWVHRFWRFRAFNSQLAPTSGSMGYGVPAAVAAKRIQPQRVVIAFAGDGCFLMSGQEFATAVQYNLPIIVIVIDNGMYGTIRMHQEREYPSRVVATDLRNPDFAAYARAFGGHGETVSETSEFLSAFERARSSGKPSIIHCKTSPEALTPTRSLSEIRNTSLQSQVAVVERP